MPRRMHAVSHLLLLVILVLLAVSCASPKQQLAEPSSPLVWPSPPDEPRITYVRSISTPADIGRTPSGWKRVVGFITGGPAEQESLMKPFGIALDETGNLCLTDTGNKA